MLRSATCTISSRVLPRHWLLWRQRINPVKNHSNQNNYGTRSVSTTICSTTTPPIRPLHKSIISIPHRHLTSSSTDHQDSNCNRVADKESLMETKSFPGQKAFVECDRMALMDLFHKYAIVCDVSGRYLDLPGLGQLLRAVGETLDDKTLQKVFDTADINGDGQIELQEFLHSSDLILAGAPAGIVLVVGGPGSGKGLLSKRLETECGVVHLSSGDLLRQEVARDSVLGRQVRDIMARGELVSSAVIVTLMRRVMRNHPGKRVLLDGFPRSLQNAEDLVELCGTPELALHLECDDTILMERILSRSATANTNTSDDDSGSNAEPARDDDNIPTALKRLRTYHKYHHSTMEWLREQHVPVVNLDCSGSAENVWEQLSAIGRLMRPVTRRMEDTTTSTTGNDVDGLLGGSTLVPPTNSTTTPGGDDRSNVA